MSAIHVYLQDSPGQTRDELFLGRSSITGAPTGSFKLCLDGTGFAWNPWTESPKRHTSSGLLASWAVGTKVKVSLVLSTQACPASAADKMPAFPDGASIPDLLFAKDKSNTSPAFPQATGGDGTLTYSIKETLPTGLTFNSTTRRITGTPSALQTAQTYTFEATDSDGDKVSLSFMISVVDNAMPSFGMQSVDALSLTKDAAMTPVTLPAATGGNAPLTYDFTSSLPAGLTVEESGGAHMLKGTPTARQDAASYTWRVTDADGETATLSFDITVIQGTAPSFEATVADQTYTQGTAISTLTLPAATGDGTVSYSLDGTLPNGLSFDASTRRITGTPSVTQAATTYTYKATDGDGDFVTLSFTITVGLPAVPGLTVVPVAGATDKLDVSWTAPTGVTFDRYVVHWKYDDLTYQAGGSRSFSAPASTLQITDLNADKRYDVRVRAVDTTTTPPAIRAESVDSATTHAATVSLGVSPNPVTEGSPVTVTATLSRALASNVTIPLTLTAGTAEAGDYGALASISITAGTTSGTGQITTAADTDTDDETFTVALGSSLPSGLTPGSTSSVEVTISEAAVADTSPDFGDATVDNQVYTRGTQITTLQLPTATGGNGTVSYALSPALPAGLSLNDTNHQITGTPTAQMAATEYTWKATDSDATNPDSDELSFTITVVVGEAPGFGQAAIADRTYVQHAVRGSIELPAAVGGDTPLTYSLTPALPAGLSFNTSTRALGGTPTAALNETQYTYKATDSNGDFVTLTFNITVDGAPTFGNKIVPDQVYTTNVQIETLTLPEATGGDGAVGYTLTPTTLPAGLSFDANTRQITGTPPAMRAAETTYTWKATDSDMTEPDSDQVSFTIEVVPPVPSVSVAPVDGTSDQLDVTWGAVTDADYTVWWKTGDQAYETSRSDTVLRGTTTYRITGLMADTEYDVRVEAEDDDGNLFQSEASGTTNAAAADTSPTFGSKTIEDQLWGQDAAIPTLTLPEATGGNGDLTYTLTGPSGGALPAGVTFDASTRQLSGMPTATQGDTTYTYKVTDSDMSEPDSVELTFTITIIGTVPGFSVVPVDGKSDSLALSWGGVTDATTYTFYRRTGSDAYSEEGSLDSDDRSATLSGLMAATRYDFRIIAFDNGGTTLAVGYATATTNADLPTATIAAGTSPVTEGTAADFTVTLSSAAPAGGLTVNLTVSEATGSDYVASANEGSKTLAFAEGDTSKTYSVATVGDATDEPNGSVTVTLATGTGYTLGAEKSASVTIRDDDHPAVAGLTVSPVGSTTDQLDVSWNAVMDATAYYIRWKTGDQEYHSTREKTVTAPATTARLTGLDPGTTYSVEVTVVRPKTPPATGIDILAQSETTGTTHGTATRSTPPTVSIAAGTSPVTEGTAASFTVTLSSEAPAGGLMVNLAVIEVTGTGSDYVAPGNEGDETLAFDEGDTSKTYSVTTVNDSTDEPDGSVRVELVSGTGYTVGAAKNATVTIQDDDDGRVVTGGGGGGGGGGPPPPPATDPEFASEASIPDQSWTQHTPITALMLPQATGGQGSLSYSLEGTLPAGLRFNANTRRITGTPTAPLDETSFTYRATDGADASATLTFTITVEAAPSFGASTIPDQSYTQHAPITALTLPAATGGQGSLSYSLEGALPAGLRFNANTRRITGTPTASLDETIFTYRATAAAASSVTLTFTITVEAAPSFGASTIPDQAWTQNTAIEAVTLPAATGGDGALQYSLAPALPAGLTFDPTTRRITGTPTGVQASTPYTYTATDEDGDTATLGFSVEVVDPRRALIQGAVEQALAATARRAMAGALDNITARFGDIGTSGVTLGSQWVPLEGTAVTTAVAAADDEFRPCAADGFAESRLERLPGCAAARSWSMEAAELFGQSAFSLHLGVAEGGIADPVTPLWSVWGRGDLGTFAGRDGPGMHYEGELRTGWLGVDARARSWVAGLAVSHSAGESEYAFADGDLSGQGRLETTLTAAYPYGRWTLGNGLELRGVVGAGTGEARHAPEGGEAETGGLTMHMASVGVRRALPALAGIALAVRADASVTGVETDAGPTAIHGLSADSWRLRAGLEASRRFALEGEHALEPFLEAVVRQDGGDGLEGGGVELAGGLRYVAPGVAVEARGRWLAAHREDGAEEQGVSITARAGPGADGRGLFFALSPRWGAATEGARALWREEMPNPSAAGNSSALEAQVGYGFALSAAGVLTPFAETSLAGDDGRRLRLGTRFDAWRALHLELAGERSERAAATPEHALRLDLRLRF